MKSARGHSEKLELKLPEIKRDQKYTFKERMFKNGKLNPDSYPKHYQSIITPRSLSSCNIGLNPNLKPDSATSSMKIFPMFGLWPEKNTFKTTQ